MKRARRRQLNGLASILLVVFLLLSSAAQAAPPQDQVPGAAPGDPGFSTVPLPKSALTLPASVALSLGDRRASIPSSIRQSPRSVWPRRASRLMGERPRRRSRAGQRRRPAGPVQVYVGGRDRRAQGATSAVKSAGGDVTKVADNDTLLQAWLPVNAIEGLAAEADVLYIRQPDVAVPLEGTLTTEGLAAANASAWQASGRPSGSARQGRHHRRGASRLWRPKGDQRPPRGPHRKELINGQTESQVDGTTPHGAACAEIVCDMAPQAQLYLVKISTTADLSEAVSWVRAQGVNVISTSVAGQ